MESSKRFEGGGRGLFVLRVKLEGRARVGEDTGGIGVSASN